MSLLRNKFIKNLLTITCLMAWVCVYHHDIWLGLLEVDHHHSHSHSHSSSAHHHHEPAPTQSDDDRDDSLPFNGSIPLPDSHSDPIALSIVKVLSTDQDLESAGYASIPFVSATIRKLIRAGSENPPPLHGWREPVPTCRDILACSVRANAPPFVS